MNIFRKMAQFWLSAPEAAFRLQPGMPSASGETVTESSSLGLSAVWGCVNLLSGVQAGLPMHVYRGTGKSRIEYDAHPLSKILRHSPNADQSAFDFWSTIAALLELRGNAYAIVHRSASGVIVALEPVLVPVSVSRRQSGALRYQWTEDGRSYDLESPDVLHIRGFYGSPLGGLSTLSHARNVFGIAAAADRTAASVFRNGLLPSAVLKFKEWLSPQNRAIAKEELASQFAGANNAGKPLVLEGDATWAPLSITPEDAQMLESRSFSVEEICRFFGVPPFMIGHTEKQTSWGSGVEQQTLGFVKYALTPRLKRIESAIERQLLTQADIARKVSVDFSLEGLLRGDSKARAEYYRTMTQIGAMTINEVRALEDRPPLPGGDTARMQAQNIPITDQQPTAQDQTP